jgi:hypothetical protein
LIEVDKDLIYCWTFRRALKKARKVDKIFVYFN